MSVRFSVARPAADMHGWRDLAETVAGAVWGLTPEDRANASRLPPELRERRELIGPELDPEDLP